MTNQPTAAELIAELRRLLAIRAEKKTPATEAAGEQRVYQRAEGVGCDLVHVGDAALREALRANPRLLGK